MTTLTREKIEALREAARKATAGPWQRVGWRPCGVYGPGDMYNAERLCTMDARQEHDANATHIANCDPATILSLCDMAEAGAVRVKPLEWEKGWCGSEDQYRCWRPTNAIGGFYRIDMDGDSWTEGTCEAGKFANLAEAKAAAQADYETRIRSSLEAGQTDRVGELESKWKDMAALSSNLAAARATTLLDLIETGRALLDALPPHWHDDATVQFRDAIAQAERLRAALSKAQEDSK